VRRDDPGSQPAECVDTISVASFGISLRRVSVGKWTASLDATGVSGGRCAGPVAGDLRTLRLPASRLGGPGLAFDLHGQAAFGAGPFSGVLISTLVLRADTNVGVSSGEETIVAPQPPSPPHHVLIEYARFRYRITGATGALGVTFAGDAAPECIPLDSCGTTGALRLTIDGFRGVIELSGTREVRHRLDRARALADVRTGQLDVFAESALMRIHSATTSESLSRTGGVSCADSDSSNVMLGVGVFPGPLPGSSLTLAASEIGSDPWRTHCPGPKIADVTGEPSTFLPFFPGTAASGSLNAKSLGSRQFGVALTTHGRFRAAGYSGTRGGRLRFSLALIAESVGTRQETVR
jgi:hypothetical protein